MSLLSVDTEVCICACVLVQVCICQRTMHKILCPSSLPLFLSPRSHGGGLTGAVTPAFQFAAP